MSDPPRWFWSQEYQQHYLYDAHSDLLVFQDGRRIPRPASVPRTAFTLTPPQAAPSSSSYATNPVPTTANYVTGPPGQQYPPQVTRPGLPPGPAPGSSRSQHGYQDPTRRSSSQVDALTQGLATVTVSTQHPAARHPQPVTPQVTIGTNGQRIVRAEDPNTNVRTIIQTAPVTAITDPALLESGIHARSRFLPSDNQVFERLFKSFRLRDQPRKFFTVGKVFLVLWVEPAGESATQVTGLEEGTTYGRFGERAFSKVRRFVVVREGDNYCSALPITSYGRRGVGKHGVNKSEHSIIYTTKVPPDPLPTELPLRGEEGMRPDAIRVDTDDPIDKLDSLSRLDYGKVHTIQHNIKVKALGKVNPKSMNALINQFGNVWSTMPAPSETSASADVGSVEQSTYAARDAVSAQRNPSHLGRAMSGGGSSRVLPPIAEQQPSDADRTATLQANVRAAVQRVMQQGYTQEQAERMIREQLARMRPSQGDEEREHLSDDDDESSDEEEEDDNEDRGTQDSKQKRGHDQRKQEASASTQARRGSSTSSQPQQRNPTQARSNTSGQSSTSTGAQQSSLRTPADSRSAASRTTGHTQSQPRSAGASSTSHAQSQAQTRAQAEALMARLLQEGKSRDEALAIIRARFGSGRSS